MAEVLRIHTVAARRAPQEGCWEIERDVIRGRAFDRAAKFMPDGLSQAPRIAFLDARERVLFSQVQGRTYANVFRMLERVVGAHMLELSRSQVLGDQDALEALVQGTQDELRHQALFGRVEMMMAGAMPQGYRFEARANDFAWIVLGRSRWSILALTSMLELVTQSHYRESIAPDPSLSQLYKDVLRFHWKDEERHARTTEREWRREHARLTARERDAAVDDLLELVRTLNMLIQRQAAADAGYFFHIVKRALLPVEAGQVHAAFVRAYRWQFILGGMQHERYADLVAELVSEEHGARIAAALHPLAVPPEPQAFVPRMAARAEAV